MSKLLEINFERIVLCCFLSLMIAPSASADGLVSLIGSELGVSEVEFCSALVGPEEEETTIFAFDEQGTPVENCPSITVEGEACVENIFGNKAQRWWRAAKNAAKKDASAKFKKEHGSLSCKERNGKCKKCTPDKGSETRVCKFDTTQNDDTSGEPNPGTISGSEESWLDPDDSNVMCVKVTYGCPYKCY